MFLVFCTPLLLVELAHLHVLYTCTCTRDVTIKPDDIYQRWSAFMGLTFLCMSD